MRGLMGAGAASASGSCPAKQGVCQMPPGRRWAGCAGWPWQRAARRVGMCPVLRHWARVCPVAGRPAARRVALWRRSHPRQDAGCGRAVTSRARRRGASRTHREAAARPGGAPDPPGAYFRRPPRDRAPAIPPPDSPAPRPTGSRPLREVRPVRRPAGQSRAVDAGCVAARPRDSGPLAWLRGVARCRPGPPDLDLGAGCTLISRSRGGRSSIG